jgi:hypothetical protein
VLLLCLRLTRTFGDVNPPRLTTQHSAYTPLRQQGPPGRNNSVNQRPFLPTQTLPSDTNSSFRHKLFLPTQTLPSDTNSSFRHKLFLPTQTLPSVLPFLPLTGGTAPPSALARSQAAPLVVCVWRGLNALVGRFGERMVGVRCSEVILNPMGSQIDSGWKF